MIKAPNLSYWLRGALFGVVLGLSLGCENRTTSPDIGPGDAGTEDSGPVDLGPSDMGVETARRLTGTNLNAGGGTAANNTHRLRGRFKATAPPASSNRYKLRGAFVPLGR